MKLASSMRQQCIYAWMQSIESGDIRLQHIRHRYCGDAASKHWKCWEQLGFSSECARMRHMTTASLPLTLETGFYSIRMASWKQRIAPESHLATQRFPLLLKKSRTLELSNSSMPCLKKCLRGRAMGPGSGRKTISQLWLSTFTQVKWMSSIPDFQRAAGANCAHRSAPRKRTRRITLNELFVSC